MGYVILFKGEFKGNFWGYKFGPSLQPGFDFQCVFKYFSGSILNISVYFLVLFCFVSVLIRKLGSGIYTLGKGYLFLLSLFPLSCNNTFG